MNDIHRLEICLQPPQAAPEGFMSELDHWSPKVAHRIAAAEGVVLEEDHFAFLHHLRDHYRNCGPTWTASALARAFKDEYASLGGSRYLYALFPKGPIAQGCRIAGLPLPHDALDTSFGSVH
ncbi:MAG: TusE/DsrC/DsvC family sulfur relay protein [Azonexus sp.]